MRARVVTFEIEAGRTTSGRLLAGPRAFCVLGHGAGGTREQESLVLLQDALARARIGSVVFNFAYAEAGRKAPDRMPLLERAFESAVAFARKRKPARLIVGGRSMGGRVASHLATREGFDGLLLLGYPLHAAGDPAKLRVEHLPAIRCRALFVSGTNDALAPARLLATHVARVPRGRLHLIEDADHGLDLPKRAGKDRSAVADEVAALVAAWIDEP